MSNTLFLRIAAAFGAAGVVLGALGAHGRIHEILVANDRLANWQTAVFYHLLHAVMLYLAASGARRGPFLCFLNGIVIFSGSLYLLSLTNVRWLGAITPIGGVSFIAGWLWLAIKPFPRAAA